MNDASPAPPAASSPASPSPLEMVKSRGYLALLVFGAIIGVPVAVIAYFFLKAVTEGQQYFFVTLPKDLGFHAAPPRDGRSQPGGGTQAGRDSKCDRSARHLHRSAGHFVLWRSTRARGAACPHRRWHRRADRAPNQTGCAGAGHHGDRRGRKLRGHRDPADFAASGSVLAAGGGGYRWRRGERGAGPWAVGGRDRRAHLRGPQQPDRVRDLLPGRASYPRRGHADRR